MYVVSKVAFIGLGVMGFPMAGHLASAGHQVRVFNRTQTKANKWCGRFNGTAQATPAEAARDCEFILVCVGDDHDIEEVICGSNGVLNEVKKDAMVVDHTTASAAIARKVHQHVVNAGARFMDAPISGGEQGAINGQLTVMLGGTQEDFDRVKPVLRAYAKTMRLIGPVGHGQKAKMVNQICIGGLLQALSEAINFARAAELDVDQVIEAISKGAAQSWQMENRYRTMLDNQFDFGFAVDWMRKDLAIALREADRMGVELPVTSLVDQYFEDVQHMGGGRWDASSLITRLQNKR